MEFVIGFSLSANPDYLNRETQSHMADVVLSFDLSSPRGEHTWTHGIPRAPIIRLSRAFLRKRSFSVCPLGLQIGLRTLGCIHKAFMIKVHAISLDHKPL
jgi:hypothetical protein